MLWQVVGKNQFMNEPGYKRNIFFYISVLLWWLLFLLFVLFKGFWLLLILAVRQESMVEERKTQCRSCEEKPTFKSLVDDIHW